MLQTRRRVDFIRSGKIEQHAGKSLIEVQTRRPIGCGSPDTGASRVGQCYCNALLDGCIWSLSLGLQLDFSLLLVSSSFWVCSLDVLFMYCNRIVLCLFSVGRLILAESSALIFASDHFLPSRQRLLWTPNSHCTRQAILSLPFAHGSEMEDIVDLNVSWSPSWADADLRYFIWKVELDDLPSCLRCELMMSRTLWI